MTHINTYSKYNNAFEYDNANGRIEYIDRAKGILMLLVILGHCIGASLKDTFIGLGTLIWIASFHMPAFFIISGMIINKTKYRNQHVGKFIKEKLYRIVAPFLFFEVIGCVLNLIWRKGEPIELLSKVFSMECVIGADWFLITYFFAVILYFVYLKLETSQICDVIIIAVILIMRWLSPDSFAESRWGINLFRILIGFSMILFGSMGKEQLVAYKKYYQWGILLAISIVCVWINGGVELWNATIGNPVLYMIAVFSGTSLILGISQVINIKITRIIGENTIAILSTHQMLLMGFTRLKTSITNSVLVFVCSIIVIATIEPVIVWFLNRFCPRLIGKK